MLENEWFEGRGDDEPESPTVLAWWIWGALALAMILVPLLAHSAEVYRDRDDQGGPAIYRLSEKPCTHPKVLEHLRAQILDDRRFKAGILTWHGKEWASCWIEVRGTVLSIDEEGSPFSPVLRKLFRDESI